MVAEILVLKSISISNVCLSFFQRKYKEFQSILIYCRSSDDYGYNIFEDNKCFSTFSCRKPETFYDHHAVIWCAIMTTFERPVASS